MGTIILFGSFAALIVLNVPISFALMGSAIAAMFFLGQSPLPIAQRMVIGANSASCLPFRFSSRPGRS